MNKSRTKNDRTEHETLRQAMSALKQSSGLDAQKSHPAGRGVVENGSAAVVNIGVGDRQWAFPAVVRGRLTNDLLGYVISHLQQSPSGRGVLVTRYVTPQQAEKLRQANVQFVDTAGNAFLNQPPLYVFVTGMRPAENAPRGKTSRAFSTTGVKVLFVLLCRPALATRPYREIAAAAGVSLGAVSHALDDLKAGGFLFDRGEKGRRLKNHEELIRRWGEAYTERLRPKLLFSRYTAEHSDWWKDVQVAKMLAKQNACWGGEVAAAKLTGYLMPQVKTIYAPNRLAALQVKFGFRPDKEGDIEILKKFWAFDSDAAHPDMAPALLVYADLMASGDERNVETARMIYDRYIARSFGEA